MIAKALRPQIREVQPTSSPASFATARRGGRPRRPRRVAEAWIFVAGGLLGTIDHRLGGLLGDDLHRVRAERRRWLPDQRLTGRRP